MKHYVFENKILMLKAITKTQNPPSPPVSFVRKLSQEMHTEKIPPQLVAGEKGKKMPFYKKFNKKIILPILNGTK